ncbi:uncharacterized protein LOC127798316 isoform X2 [Diospyros lotus]|uniref:uncharacterized protein LOC127798316 isoform X2 n=1 Tax=Diospyros lotus TaxID=55363 RepID=UPI002258A0DB|nr:uncharacterized protein LOC127798316 isoform X2 [Diospyros lotus]XP_052187756.1 uncharacterized protein LOC127798316 isoform X2 [Diospyros lotus]XP_052187757.1 uncharacterized protein LOC127798316 isoform X2 [Diospyros lotus]
MFASQLLRILQTLPHNGNHGTCGLDAGELGGIMNKNQNGVLNDLNNCENDAVPLASKTNNKDGSWNKPELECAVFLEDSAGYDNEASDYVIPCTITPCRIELFEEKHLSSERNNNENEVRNENESEDSAAPCTIPSGKMEFSEKNTDLCTDKKVVQCELPELIVCYNENSYHVVKDICIDEGLHSTDKISGESEPENDLCITLPSNENKHVAMTKERKDIELDRLDASKILSEDHNKAHESGMKEKVETELTSTGACKILLGNQFNGDIHGRSLTPVQTVEANSNVTDTIVDDVSKEKFAMSSLPFSENFNEQELLKTPIESPDSDLKEDGQGSFQIPCSEAKCESGAMVSAPEESNKGKPANGLSYDGKVENSTISFGFNSSKAQASGRHENPDDVDRERTLKSDSETRLEDGISGRFSIGSDVQHGQGDSSFSMAGPGSGLITFSGSIPYSGSISLRSDSSTTSARSFAFPILQSEWNSSPVRMAKADRRQYRKHRGWRQGLLCCRF